MKNRKTYYLMILDRSGSMSDCIQETISGFNEQIQMINDLQRRNSDQEFYISLTTFNHQIEHNFREVKVEHVKQLTTNTYIPDGGTALLDAIGEGVINLKASRGHEFDNDEATAVVVILTDGHENSSRIFKLDAIRMMIRELEATNNWTFSFMGATADAIDVAGSMNIRRQNSVFYDKSDIKQSISNLAESMEKYADEKAKGKKPKDFLK
ncbi:MAG TPA: VWA domain-containing protein [Bacteroidia bacterium]|nr:VWA domain-containing protein [Bacteroidia bacterium]